MGAGSGCSSLGQGQGESLALALQRGRGVGNMWHVTGSCRSQIPGRDGNGNTDTAPVGIATTGAVGSGCCAWVFKRGWIIFTTTNDPICA